MYQQVNFSDFCDGFTGSYKDNFSYEGKRALFDYLDDYEESTGEQIEFDPIALCCEYTEYRNFAELQADYPNVKALDDLESQTEVITIYNVNEKETGGLIIKQF